MNDSRDAVLAEWHDWYAQALAHLRELTLDDIVISWLAHVRPNVWRLAWEPHPVERAQWPGQYLQPALGEWWGPEGLARSHAQTAIGRDSIYRGVVAGEPGFYFSGQIGHLAKLNEVAILHQRGWQAKGSLRLPVDPTGTQDDEFAWGQALSRFRFGLAGVSRRKGSAQTKPPPDWPGDPAMWVGPRRRSSVQWASLLRALLIAGLVCDGVDHRPAIRAWLGWEIELSGPWSNRKAVKKAWKLLRLGDMYALRDFEEGRTADNRRLWKVLGIEPIPI